MAQGERAGLQTYHNQHEHGADAGLEEAEEEALDVEALIGLANRREKETETPDSDNKRGNALNGEALRENYGRVTSNNEADIEDGRGEGVPVADVQAQVGPQPKKSLVGG